MTHASQNLNIYKTTTYLSSVGISANKKSRCGFKDTDGVSIATVAEETSMY